MDEKGQLEQIKSGKIGAKELKKCFIERVSKARPKNETEPQRKERERVIQLIGKISDTDIVPSSKEWLEEFLAIKEGEKKRRNKLVEDVKTGIQRVMGEHTANYGGWRTPAVAYLPGVGSERLEKKLEKCRTPQCAKETLYELLDMILESSKASFETLKEELAKEIKKAATTIYIGAAAKNKQEPSITEAITKKLTYYSKAEGEASEEIPQQNIALPILQRLSNGDPTRIMLFMFYPEIVNALLKYSALQEDNRIDKYLSDISAAFAKMPTLPQAVAEELLKPLSFGEFLYTKLSMC